MFGDAHLEAMMAKLLVEDKPYTILIALGVIAVSMVNCYLSKVFE